MIIKSKKNSAGFSLIEILIGSAIVIAAATVVLSVVISSFRISTKTTTASVIRQNGNYTLSQMSRIIQFADSFDNVKSGSTTYNDCSGTTYSSLTEVNVVYDGRPTRIFCSGDRIYINSGSGNETSMDVNKVGVTACSFTCTQTGDEGPEIGINFSLSTKGSNTPEETSSIDFSTSVKMRNL